MDNCKRVAKYECVICGTKYCKVCADHYSYECIECDPHLAKIKPKTKKT